MVNRANNNMHRWEPRSQNLWDGIALYAGVFAGLGEILQGQRTLEEIAKEISEEWVRVGGRAEQGMICRRQETGFRASEERAAD